MAPEALTERGSARRGRPALLLALGVFLIVFGARLWVIERHGSVVPYLDQWDAEAVTVIQPWLHDRFTPALLFSAHNEHRVVLTRLVTLGLFVGNGRWDPLLETVVSSAVYAFTLAWIALGFRRLVPGRFANAVTGGVLALGVVPFGWENTLFGFQSQFYFLVLFSMLAMWGLGTQAVFSRAWWLGAIAGFVACFAMGSGFISAAAVLGTSLLLRVAVGRRTWQRRDWVTVAVCLGIIAVGYAARNVVPGHAVLRPQSVGVFLRSFLQCLAWPWTAQPWLALALYAPLLAWMIVAWRTKDGVETRSNRFWSRGLLLVAIWVVAQAAAIAYGRGGNWEAPSSRYTDLLAFGALANFAAALRLLEMWPARPLARRAAWIGAVVWTALVLTGLVGQMRHAVNLSFPAVDQMMAAQESVLRRYVLTGDRALVDGKTYPEIPYPDPGRIVGLMNDRTFVAILPASLLQDPAAVSADSPPLDPGPLSRWADFLLRHAGWIMGIGLSCLGWGWVISRRAVGRAAR